MVKVTYCLRRREGMTWDEFSRYWSDVHAPLVEARAALLGIRRYVQVRTADAPQLHDALQRRNGGSPAPFDGIAELWFDSIDDFARPTSDEARRAAVELLEDERNFIDLASSPMWVGQESVRFERPG